MTTYPLRLEVRINSDLRDAIEHEAAEQERSYAWIIRTALKNYLRDHGGGTDTKAA